MDPEDPTAPPKFTLSEIVDLERPARHRDGAGQVDYIYDGITFWCDREGQKCPFPRSTTMPQEEWRHRPDCDCRGCREARVGQRRRGWRAATG